MQEALIILSSALLVWIIFGKRQPETGPVVTPKIQNPKITVKVRHCKINPQTEEIDFGDVQDLEVEANKKFKKGDRIGDNPLDFYVVL